MKYVPPWWYVIDSRQSLSFTFIVIILDSFPMSLLFFLAGYFAPCSLARRGTGSFIRAKLFRLGVPWVAGVLLVAPFLARASLDSLGIGPLSVQDFLWGFFAGVYYQQGQFWFLGILLFFMLAYALWGKALPRRALVNQDLEGRDSNGKDLHEQNATGRDPGGQDSTDWEASRQNARLSKRDALQVHSGNFSVLAIAAVVTAASYALSCLYVAPPDAWLDLGRVLYFQPARLAGYAGFFWLGTHGAGRGWFRPGGWKPDAAFWGLIAVAMLFIRLAWTFVPAVVPGLPERMLQHPFIPALV